MWIVLDIIVYVNGERVSSLDEKDIFSGIYKDVKLTKGDRLTFRTLTNRAITNEGFEIAVFSIKDVQATI